MKTLNSERPTERNAEIVSKAVDMLLPSVWDWVTATSGAENYPNDERESVRQDLSKAVGRAFDADGYKIARNLESSALWEPDSELVDILDSFYSYLNQAHRDAVKAWVDENKIIPQHKVGDRVIVHVLREEYEGVIIRVDNTTAQYIINVEALNHVPHTFSEENGVLVAKSIGAAETNGVYIPVEQVDD